MHSRTRINFHLRLNSSLQLRFNLRERILSPGNSIGTAIAVPRMQTEAEPHRSRLKFLANHRISSSPRALDRDQWRKEGDWEHASLPWVNKFGSLGRIPGFAQRLESVRDTNTRETWLAPARWYWLDVRRNRGPGPRLASRASICHQSFCNSNGSFDRQGRGRP